MYAFNPLNRMNLPYEMPGYDERRAGSLCHKFSYTNMAAAIRRITCDVISPMTTPNS